MTIVALTLILFCLRLWSMPKSLSATAVLYTSMLLGRESVAIAVFVDNRYDSAYRNRRMLMNSVPK